MKLVKSDKMSNVKGSAIREIFKLAGDPNVISLAGGNPSPDTFPNEELAKIAEKYLRENPVLSLQYGVTEGYMPLRDAVKKRLSEKENINLENNELIIVSGGQQGIELLTKVLINEGDTVIVEEPSFIGALNAFRSYGANLAGVPLEDNGVNIEALEKAIKENKNVKLMYLIPTFQNPSGKTMSQEKRKLVYDLAVKNNIIIIEDNPYGDLTFDGIKEKTIKSIDTEGIVVYCGSFSKVIAPGLRVGYTLAHKDIISAMVIAKQVSDVHTSMLPQLLTYEYLTKCDFDKNIESSRKLYAHKCSVMIEAIKKYFPKEVSYTVPKGGLFIWCDLNGDYDTQEIAKECVKKNVVFVPGSTFMVDMEKPCSAFRLNYSTMDDDKIVKGIEILGSALKEIMDK